VLETGVTEARSGEQIRVGQNEKGRTTSEKEKRAVDCEGRAVGPPKGQKKNAAQKGVAGDRLVRQEGKAGKIDRDRGLQG